jgi:outer membrane receptor protein involved in Fe transport
LVRTRNSLDPNKPLNMVIIVDGNIMDGSHLNDLDASNISSIEVLKSGSYLAVYGSNAPGGALVITTKRGSGSSYVTSEKPAGLISYPFKGFYKARAFYSPKYIATKTSAQAPDLRNTIYWNPNLVTDKDGKVSFQYFNNDTRGTYRVVVEGIDDNGNLGRQVYRYKVE